MEPKPESMGSIREKKLIDMKHLEVESDIIRGISLQKTLRSFGAVWMKSHPGKRRERWERSIQVQRFDLFLSHTWLTNGRWKVLSLLLQSSWPIFLVGWIIAVLAAIPLHFMEDLPNVLSYTCTSFAYEGSCTLRVYTHYFGMMGGILGLLLAPYIPSFREKMCFLDVVSIHQVVLYARTSLHWLFPTLNWPEELSYALHAVIILPFLHYCREILHKKRQMIQDLRNFDLTRVQCSSSFDRDFIQAGICKWYGSSEAFTIYVKGPLADELAEPFSRFRVPQPYWAVLAAPLISFELCWILAIINAGASVQGVAWMCWIRTSHVLLELTEIKFVVEACDYFAEPSNLNLVKTSCVWVGLIAMIFIIWQLQYVLEAAGELPAFMSSLLVVVIFIIFVLGEVNLLPDMWKARTAFQAPKAES